MSLWWFAVAAEFAALAVVFNRYEDRIAAWLDGLTDRLRRNTEDE